MGITVGTTTPISALQPTRDDAGASRQIVLGTVAGALGLVTAVASVLRGPGFGTIAATAISATGFLVALGGARQLGKDRYDVAGPDTWETLPTAQREAVLAQGFDTAWFAPGYANKVFDAYNADGDEFVSVDDELIRTLPNGRQVESTALRAWDANGDDNGYVTRDESQVGMARATDEGAMLFNLDDSIVHIDGVVNHLARHQLKNGELYGDQYR